MRVDETTTRDVVAVPDAADILAENHVRRFIVVDKNNKFAGLAVIDRNVQHTNIWREGL